MTAMLDQLEDAGMISRRRSTADRRQVIVALTEPAARRWPPSARSGSGLGANGLAGHSEEELLAAARVMRTLAALLDGFGRE